MDFLCFWLIGPIGAFGGPAGHEFRKTAQAPTRSGVLGLIGAAMGIRRDDGAEQSALRGLGVSVATYRVGIGFRDFHTIQTVPSARIKLPKSRAVALAALSPDDNAVITRRDYVTDCAYGVAVWRRDDTAPDLESIAHSLKTPVFVPFLGRKSCPVSHPMAPVQVSADTSVAVFDALPKPSVIAECDLRVITTDQIIDGHKTEWLMDDPIDRQKWHFARRAAVTVFGVGGMQ